MEKRVLLAAVLSGIVVIIWFSLFAPKPPSTPAGPAAGRHGGGGAGGNARGRRGEPAAQEAATPAVPAGPVVAAEVGEDKTPIALSGDGWRATVNPAGGVISSLIVEGYRDDAGRASGAGPRRRRAAAVGRRSRSLE